MMDNVQEIVKELQRLAEQRRNDAASEAIGKKYYWVHRYRGMAYAYEDAALVVQMMSPQPEPVALAEWPEETR